ncbi:uncharacterized protein LOC109827353 isoform X1 [Asparagus officinalis]|uniref:uncharacterized protein LOC109827353 isoform X1 n=1 Tax=Asparagus officinalis TaxID=4686 RepID=UPI00098E7704|nr:uncharacterized protein LOC109827353 isoform X1 [Asparagus officinalis]
MLDTNSPLNLPLFKFEKRWLIIHSFPPFIVSCWNSLYLKGNHPPPLRFKLKLIKNRIKWWKRNCFASISQLLSNNMARIDSLNLCEESRSLSRQESQHRSYLKDQLLSLAKAEEIKWKQRSRIQWLKEGAEEDMLARRLHRAAFNLGLQELAKKSAPDASGDNFLADL